MFIRTVKIELNRKPRIEDTKEVRKLCRENSLYYNRLFGNISPETYEALKEAKSGETHAVIYQDTDSAKEN